MAHHRVWPRAICSPNGKPPASEDADGIFRAFTSRKVAALEAKHHDAGFVSAVPGNSPGGVLFRFRAVHFIGDNG
jgi:hypothetical protein